MKGKLIIVHVAQELEGIAIYVFQYYKIRKYWEFAKYQNFENKFIYIFCNEFPIVGVIHTNAN